MKRLRVDETVQEGSGPPLTGNLYRQTFPPNTTPTIAYSSSTGAVKVVGEGMQSSLYQPTHAVSYGAMPTAAAPHSGKPQAIQPLSVGGHAQMRTKGASPPTAPPQGPQQQQSPGSSFQRLKVEDALSYLDLVKFKFGDKPQVYNDFLDIMKEFKSQSIDTPGVIQRVSNLFNGFPDLIVGFNTFLPPGYKIEVQKNDRGYAFQVSVSVPSPTGTMVSDSTQKPAMILTGSGTIIHSNMPPMSQPTCLPQSQQLPISSHVPSSIAPQAPVSTPVLHHSTGYTSAATIHNNTSHNAISMSAAQAAVNQALQGGHTEAPQNQPVEFNHAINYVNKIKAAAICQALLEGGYIECVSDPCSFVDGYTLYKLGIISSPDPIPTVFENNHQGEPSWIQQIPQESCTTDSETEQISPSFARISGRLTSSSSYTLDLNVGANTVYLSKPPLSSHSLNSPDSESDMEKHMNFCTETSVVRTSEQREFVPESGWHNPSHLRDENSEKTVYNLLAETFKQHERTLLKQLLIARSLQLTWNEVLIPLVHEVVDVIRPDVNHNAEDLDVRQFVQFKKLPDGDRTDCKLIRGIVCSKNVAHKGMPTKFENPKILLLEGSIVYQRTEGRLMSLEPVLMQEHEYLRHVAARVIALQPNIVLVQRNVSRLAQDLLRQQGVTLVLNVKQRILERIARCTQADLVTSVDAHIGRPRLGVCKYFYLKSYKNEYGDKKTLMFFEGLPLPHLGGTILLRGATKPELVKLKKVMSLLLFASYNWRLEKSFLMDEFAQPPNIKDEFFDDSKESSPVLTTPSSQINGKEIRKLSRNCDANTNLFDDNESDTEYFNTNHVNELVNANCEERKSNYETVNNYTDPLHTYNSEDEVFLKRKSQKFSVAELPFSNHFRKSLDDTILCISPYLMFSVPYLETENGRKCKLRSFFPDKIFYSEYFLDKTKTKCSKELENGNNIDKKSEKAKMKPPHPFITTRITTSIDNSDIQGLLAHFRACGGRLEKKPILDVIESDSESNIKPKLKGIDLDKLDVLDPNNHQRLAVLFCSFSHESHNAPAFCVNPWVVYMDFYGCNDIPLGCFLERYCFRSTYSCQSKTCDTPMLKHIRRFVHNLGCVSLSLNSVENEFSEDNIHMWSWCVKCETCSPIVSMSGDTWSFSFAKYLELRFHGGVYTRRGNVPCQHSLHHDNFQYFGFKNIVASFKFTNVQLWEISLPPPIIDIKYDTYKQQDEMIEEIRTMALKGHEIFLMISEKLSSLPGDVDGLSNLKQILMKEQAGFKHKIEEVQLKLTSPTLEFKEDQFTEPNLDLQAAVWRIADALVRIKRIIVEAIEQWNMRFSESFRKRDSDKRRDKSSHSDLDSPSTDIKPFSLEVSEAEVKTVNPNIEATNVITKKNKSLDQGDVNLNSFKFTSTLTCPKEPFQMCDIMSAPIDNSLSSLVCSDTLQVTKTGCRKVADNNLDVKQNLSDFESNKFVILKRFRKNKSFPPYDKTPYGKLVRRYFETCPDKDGPPPSPKGHHRSQSDGTVLSQYEDSHDGKKETDKKSVKTILSQLLPSTSSFTPLPLPFHQQEHYTLPSGIFVPIVVYEAEPSSIVAYALNSYDYKRAFDDLLGKKMQSNEQTPSPIHKRYSQIDKERLESSETTISEKPAGILSFLRTKDSKSDLSSSSSNTAMSDSSQNSDQSSVTEKTDDLKKNKVSQIDITFEDSNCNFFCRIYYAEKFAILRSTVLPIGEEAYVRSLSRSVQWNARGGKSGSTFCKTMDDRFILKEMPKSEIQLFLDFAPNYFSYMKRCHTTAQPTLLGKIVGIYQIIFKNNSTNATLRTNLLVMENLFYNRTVSQKFDLKGSMRNRLVNPDNQDGEIVLLDENLLKMSCDSPLYILPHSKAVLTAAIQNDTEFLSAQSVMDYSLLVGLDSENKELVLGIIDYIRTFTWDKKLETMVKKSGMLWGQVKLPTIVSPEEYCKRFIEAMHRYFLEVPDPWAGLGKGLEC